MRWQTFVIVLGTISLSQSRALHNKERNCNLCKDNWLFILGTGRSGTTSLMTMLNAIPGLYISGEPKSTMQRMLNMYSERPGVWSEEKGLNEIRAHWHKPVDYERLLCDLQQYVKDMIGQSEVDTEKIIGFKDINAKDERSLLFYKELFPCARYIMNWRETMQENPQLHNSAFKTLLEMKDTSLAKLSVEREVKKTWARNNSLSAFTLPLEDFAVDKFNALLKWLNIEDCKYTAVAHANSFQVDQGYHPDKLFTAGKLINGKCTFLADGKNLAIPVAPDFVHAWRKKAELRKAAVEAKRKQKREERLQYV